MPGERILKYRSWAWVRIGQFRPPSTMEGWTSVRYLDFLERSTPCQAFNSHRRIGAMAYAMRDDTSPPRAALCSGSVLSTGRILANDFSLYHVELAGHNGQFHFQSDPCHEEVVSG
jgi:phosphate-selective porin